MEELFMFIAVMFGAAAVLWIIAAVLRKQQDAENNAQPVNRKMAKLVDMQRIDTGGIVVGEMWVLFELEGGQRVRLNAKPQNSLVVGDVGMLTWQGKRILGFQRKTAFKENGKYVEE